MNPDETPGDRTIRYLKDFGRGVLGLLWLLLEVALRFLLPLAIIFAVVYLAVKAAQ
jgi:hypothetical protein